MFPIILLYRKETDLGVTKFSFFSETLKNKVFNYDCSKEVKDIIYTAQLFHEICPEADVLDVISKLILSNEQTVGKLAMTNLLKSNILNISSITFKRKT